MFMKKNLNSLLIFTIAFGWMQSVQSQNMQLIGGTSMIVNSGTTMIVPGTISIDGGAILDNNGQIVISGDWMNDGTTPVGAGELRCEGQSAQTIGGNAVSQFHHLTIDNNAGVTLAQSCLVDGTLEFISGKIVTNSNRVTLNAPSIQAISGAGTASYVKGNLGVVFPTGGQAMKYEIGDDTYAPASLNISNVATGGEIIIHTHTGSSNFEGTDIPGLDAQARVDQHWIVNPGGTTYTGALIGFDFTNTTYGGAPEDYQAWQYAGGIWGNTPTTIVSLSAEADAGTDISGHWVIGEQVEPDFVASIEGLGGLTAWPVPANERVQLVWEGQQAIPGQVRLYNLTGQVVSAERLLPDGGKLRCTLDTAGLAPGNYVAELRSGDAFTTTRILVLH